jgi:thioredoxin-like negative regulator of GroEL
MKSPVEVTETNFEAEVFKSSQAVLVEFAPGWTLPSMTLDGVPEVIASEIPQLFEGSPGQA